MSSTNDLLRVLAAQGQVFSATTGLLSSATNANLYGGMELFVPAPAGKTIYLFNIVVSNVNLSGDIRVNQLTVQDAQLTAVLAALNMMPSSPNQSVAAIMCSPAAFTVSGAQIGVGQVWQGSAVANAIVNPTQNIPGFFLKPGQGVAVYNKIPTAGNTFAVTMQWGEY